MRLNVNSVCVHDKRIFLIIQILDIMDLTTKLLLKPLLFYKCKQWYHHELLLQLEANGFTGHLGS